MSREAELEKEGISLLGNQNVKYPEQYAPEILETFLCKIQLSGVYESLSDHRTAGFCNDHYIICSGGENGGE